MAYIYKITNQLNNKCYIGKTNYSNPEKRWNEHKRNTDLSRPLYRALYKYGKDNFSFKVIEETNKPIQREQYWIKYYNSYGNTGYNATRGGDGKNYLDYDKIISDYKEKKNITEVAYINNCDKHSVSSILKQNNINVFSSDNVLREKLGKKVQMIDLKTNEILKIFSSQIEAARYLIDNKYSKTFSPESLSSKISLVVRKKRKSCGGFGWKLSE